MIGEERLEDVTEEVLFEVRSRASSDLCGRTGFGEVKMGGNGRGVDAMGERGAFFDSCLGAIRIGARVDSFAVVATLWRRAMIGADPDFALVSDEDADFELVFFGGRLVLLAFGALGSSNDLMNFSWNEVLMAVIRSISCSSGIIFFSTVICALCD